MLPLKNLDLIQQHFSEPLTLGLAESGCSVSSLLIHSCSGISFGSSFFSILLFSSSKLFSFSSFVSFALSANETKICANQNKKVF